MAPRFSTAWLEQHRVRLEGPIERHSIVGIGEVLTEVDSLLGRLRNPDAVRRMGADLPRGILLHGEPGLGKTLVARYLGSNLGPDVPLYELSADELGPSLVRDLFGHLGSLGARSALYVDELDLVAMHRDWSRHGSASRAILVALLAALDGLRPAAGPIVIASSNRDPGLLDPALMRPGRIGFHIEFRWPDPAERAALLRLFLAGRPVAPEVELATLAALARGASPASLRQAVDDASGLALAAGRERISQADLVAAIRRNGAVRPGDGQPDDAALERAAVHEAGHVAVAVALRGPGWVHRVRASAGEGDTALGEEGRPIGSIPADELADQLVVAFGGLEAETAVYGHASLGAAGDLNRATALAHRMAQGGLVPTVSAVDLDGFGPYPGTTVPDLLASAVPPLLAERRERAAALVRANLEPIRAFAAALVAADGQLVEEALEAAIAAAGLTAPDTTTPARTDESAPNRGAGLDGQ